MTTVMVETTRADSDLQHGHGRADSLSALRNDVLVTHREEIIATVEKRHFRGVALVGSVARGEDGADSDVDFLVERVPGLSTLLGLSGLISDLGQLLGVHVDVVPREYVRPSHRGMFEDVIPL